MVFVKLFYVFFRDGVFKKPIVNVYWQQKFKYLKEENIWNNMKGTIIETKLESLEYFVRHKVVFIDVLLNETGTEQSATCQVCHEVFTFVFTLQRIEIFQWKM